MHRLLSIRPVPAIAAALFAAGADSRRVQDGREHEHEHEAFRVLWNAEPFNDLAPLAVQ
jgi:hypothetical protein